MPESAGIRSAPPTSSQLDPAIFPGYIVEGSSKMSTNAEMADADVDVVMSEPVDNKQDRRPLAVPSTAGAASTEEARNQQ